MGYEFDMEPAALASWESTRMEPGRGCTGGSGASSLGVDLGDESELEDCTTLGRFRLVRRIGAGAMGVVFEGHDPELDRRVALKVLRSDAAAQSGLQARSRMIREAQALARLRHPHVTTVYQVGTSDRGVFFIAMELVEGRTLKGWVRSRPRTWREIVEVLLQAGRGLAAAHHAGLVHRDFKPDNVIVDERGQARVVDFGLARASGVGELMPTLDDEDSGAIALHLTCTGALLGTPAYMAPEQFDGGPAQARSDQFSFCVALFEALYGRRPFAGNDLPSLQRSLARGKVVGPRRGIPRRLHRVLKRGLSTDPAERFPDMDVLLDALEACLQRPSTRRSILLVAALATAAATGSLLSGRSAGASPATTGDPSVQVEAEHVVAQAAGAVHRQ